MMVSTTYFMVGLKPHYTGSIFDYLDDRPLTVKCTSQDQELRIPADLPDACDRAFRHQAPAGEVLSYAGFYPSYWGFHSHRATPIAGWFIVEIPPRNG